MGNCRLYRLLTSLLFASFAISRAHAQEQEATAPMLDVRGNMSVGLWSGDRVLSDQGASGIAKLQLQAASQWDSAWSVRANANLNYFEQTHSTSKTRAVQAHWREAYLKWDGEQTEWKIGTQVFSWGRADRLNPTDNLSARDFTSPFATDDEQRLGSFASSLSQHLNADTRLNLIVQQVKKSVFPSDRLESKLAVAPLHRDYDYAIKLDQSGSEFDWSVSYFDGVEKTRSLELIQTAGALKGVQRRYRGLQSFGADAATTIGSWGLRAELAYLRFKSEAEIGPDKSSNKSAANGAAIGAGRLSHWYGVFGVENNLGSNASIGVQYFFRQFKQDPNFPDLPTAWRPTLAKLQVANNQFHQWQDGVTLRYAQRLMNDQLDYEIVAMSNLRDGDVVLRPRLNYRYSDSVKWVFGCDVFRGNDHSFFGSLKKNSLALTELVFIF